MKTRKLTVFPILSFLFLLQAGIPWAQVNDKAAIVKSFHAIASADIYDWVAELASPRFGGRLTGTAGYDSAAAWCVRRLRKWGIAPGYRGKSYYQPFSIPYTLVYPGCSVSLHLPVENGTITKQYLYEKEFMPGSTSGSGEVTGEVIYVGYGVSAPELDYDDYGNVDVAGKIVLMEREAPVDPDQDSELFLKWRPYSFHQYKLENAVKHGAIGMIYNYGPIGNPNNSYVSSFIYSHVGEAVVGDVFAGTGKDHQAVVNSIKKELKPRSFATGKMVTIKNITEHVPNGRGANIIGVLEGSDPDLEQEAIILGAHLDHLGHCYELIPGANDNASGVAVVLGVVQALVRSGVKLRRSVVFILFGAEEQAVVGSEVYLKDPVFPLDKTICFLNLDGVGCGDNIFCLAGENFPGLFSFVKMANQSYIHRVLRSAYFSNLARPRLDAARFLWAGVPSLSFSVSGARSYYHVPSDDISTITPEVMEDLAGILYFAIINMANADNLSLPEGADK